MSRKPLGQTEKIERKTRTQPALALILGPAQNLGTVRLLPAAWLPARRSNENDFGEQHPSLAIVRGPTHN